MWRKMCKYLIKNDKKENSKRIISNKELFIAISYNVILQFYFLLTKTRGGKLIHIREMVKLT